MTATKQDVLYALLALDAYNRHDDDDKVKISIKDKEIGTQVGNATWIQSSDRIENAPGDMLAGSKLAGFSASYYEIPGKTLISYRGTDFDFSSWSGLAEFLKDVGAGWAQSFGLLDPDNIEFAGKDIAQFQPYYAIKFFEAVTNSKVLLSDEEKKALIEAGQKVGALEKQFANGLQAKQEAESDLVLARASLENIRPVYEQAQQAAAAGIVGEVDTPEEAELQTTLDSASTQFNFFNDPVLALGANDNASLCKVAA